VVLRQPVIRAGERRETRAVSEIEGGLDRERARVGHEIGMGTQDATARIPVRVGMADTWSRAAPRVVSCSRSEWRPSEFRTTSPLERRSHLSWTLPSVRIGDTGRQLFAKQICDLLQSSGLVVKEPLGQRRAFANLRVLHLA
jgi:hypothetical protein